MENDEQVHFNHFFYKFRSLDKDLETKVKCLLKGCHRIAKYSISLVKPSNLSNEKNQVMKFICSSHLENWDSIKANIIDDKSFKE